MKVSAQYAEEHFAEILDTAMRGDEDSVRLTLITPHAALPLTVRFVLWVA